METKRQGDLGKIGKQNGRSEEERDSLERFAVLINAEPSKCLTFSDITKHQD